MGRPIGCSRPTHPTQADPTSTPRQIGHDSPPPKEAAAWGGAQPDSSSGGKLNVSSGTTPTAWLAENPPARGTSIPRPAATSAADAELRPSGEGDTGGRANHQHPTQQCQRRQKKHTGWDHVVRLQHSPTSLARDEDDGVVWDGWRVMLRSKPPTRHTGETGEVGGACAHHVLVRVATTSSPSTQTSQLLQTLLPDAL